ncbi:MAG: helix-turn-helix transcriptional regulator [Verrucomicrobiota bacterium]
MDKIKALNQRNPVTLACEIGQQLKRLRLAKGWTQEELSEKSGVAVSTLKLLEAKGSGSFQRLIRVAIALGVDGELRGLFAQTGAMESIEAVKRSERQRAPRRRKEGAGDGT